MNHDPYFAGHRPEKSAAAPGPLLVGWGIVYVLNLIVPLQFGMAITEKSGRQGMTVAIVSMLGLGCCAASTHRRALGAVIIGGGFVAVTQFIPFLQMFAGLLGLWMAEGMGHPIARNQVGSEFGGFVATVVTGGLLITLALVVGWMVRGVSAWVAGLGAGGSPTAKPGGLDVA